MVEIRSKQIDAYFKQERRPDYGNMIFERHVQILYSAHCQLVTVNVEHEREHLDCIVLDYALHLHIVNETDLFVLEQKFARQCPEHLVVAYGEVVPADSHHSIDARHNDIHIGVKVCRSCHLAV